MLSALLIFLSLPSALVSIWRILSLVTPHFFPTLSSVCGSPASPNLSNMIFLSFLSSSASHPSRYFFLSPSLIISKESDRLSSSSLSRSVSQVLSPRGASTEQVLRLTVESFFRYLPETPIPAESSLAVGSLFNFLHSSPVTLTILDISWDTCIGSLTTIDWLIMALSTDCLIQ